VKNAVIEPGPLRGQVRAVASKSQAHRLLICAALAERPTFIICRESSRDIEATARCLSALGAVIRFYNGLFHVTPIWDGGRPGGIPTLDCGESGSTLRFMLPLVGALGLRARLKMHGRLPQRPLSPFWQELERHGMILERPEPDVIEAGGRLIGGSYELPGNVSSQFVSGLLMALPLCRGGRVKLTSVPESTSYIYMTRQVQEYFGVYDVFEGETFTAPPAAHYVSPGIAAAEGDWSNAAFWACAKALGGEVELTGLDECSFQGDRAVPELLRCIRQGGAVLSMAEVPDLLPILSVAAALTPGKTEFVNAARLRLKESDRLKSAVAMLRALGGQAEETNDGITVYGADSLAGGTVDSANDHRIAMGAAIAAASCRGGVTVLGAQCVEKSYPRFWEDFAALGGKVTLTQDREET